KKTQSPARSRRLVTAGNIRLWSRKGFREKRKRPVVSVGDLHVSVVELFVDEIDAAGGEPAREDPGSVLQVPLIPQTAVEVQQAQGAERRLVKRGEPDRVPRQPPRPHVVPQLA